MHFFGQLDAAARQLLDYGVLGAALVCLLGGLGVAATWIARRLFADNGIVTSLVATYQSERKSEAARQLAFIDKLEAILDRMAEAQSGQTQEIRSLTTEMRAFREQFNAALKEHYHAIEAIVRKSS